MTKLLIRVLHIPLSREESKGKIVTEYQKSIKILGHCFKNSLLSTTHVVSIGTLFKSLSIFKVLSHVYIDDFKD